MKKVLLVVLVAVGVLSILAFMLLAGFGLLFAMAEPGVGSRVILEVNLERGVIEQVPDDPLARVMLEGVLEVGDLVDALEKAAGDRRVKALVARVGSGGMGLSHLQEVRNAVLAFRESGKPAIAYAETFGEFGPGNGGYYLATAFDEIYLQPSGDLGLTGVIYESMFLKKTLEKIGVEPRMDRRHEYKNATNQYTETEYTEPHREAMERIAESQFEQIVQGISAERSMTDDEVRALIDRGPFLGPEALEAGLVDGLAYRDEVYAKVQERAGQRARPLYIDTYLKRAGGPNTRGTTIALVHGFGSVARGSSTYGPLDGSVVMGADTVAGALRSAIDDSRVKAIVFRVDSPGGSYSASDTIWRETIRAREADKPLIVSMGNLAGSGGYYVAMDAEKIVAQPGTITASIGVFGGKMLTAEMWGKLGITWDDVHTSRNSRFWSSFHDYDRRGQERFQAGLDRIYDDFTSKVAAGRDLPLEQVQRIARGRIWTGADAKELGLVDELGGYDVALRLAREAIGLDADAPIRVKRFPARRGTFEMLFGQRPDRSAHSLLPALARTVRSLQPWVRTLKQLAPVQDTGSLSMPPVGAGP